MPKLDGQYLFRDYETTLHYVKIACDNTAREKVPLYALWLLSEKVEDLASLLAGVVSCRPGLTPYMLYLMMSYATATY